MASPTNDSSNPKSIIIRSSGDDSTTEQKGGNDKKHRQYLLDRVRGTSRYGRTSRPPCVMCLVPPCVYYCSTPLEQNCLCERAGTIGCVPHDDPKIRKRVFMAGLVSNLIAAALTFLACFSVSSTNFEMIRFASFSRGVQSVLNVTEQGEEVPLSYMDIGLTAVAVTNFIPFTNRTDPQVRMRAGGMDRPYWGRRVVKFNRFCDFFRAELALYMEPGQCDACHQSSSGFVTSVILSLVLIIPSIASDILRMYPNYDVNCQKFFGSIIAAVSLASSLYVCLKYNNACFAGFYQGLVGHFHNFSIASPGTPNVNVIDFQWQAGNGLIFLYTAIALKSIDIICNVIVPTPTITRDHREQEEYEQCCSNGTGDGDKNQEEEEQQQQHMVILGEEDKGKRQTLQTSTTAGSLNSQNQLIGASTSRVWRVVTIGNHGQFYKGTYM